MTTILDNNQNSKEIIIISELSTFKISFLLQELLGESITKYYLQWNGIFIIGISYLYTTCYISSLRNETKIVLRTVIKNVTKAAISVFEPHFLQSSYFGE